MLIGWIRLYRKVQDCDLWTDPEPFDRRSAWIDLLLLANHEDKQIIFKGHPVVVKAGQRITSVRKLADRWHWSVNRVKRYLDLLQALHMITKESDNNRTLLTVVNYGIYQHRRNTDEYTNEYSDEHTDEYSDDTVTDTLTNTPTNTVTDTKQEIKNDIRMKKNEKNEKNEKKERKETYGEYGHVRLTKTEFDRLCNDFGEGTTLKAIKAVDEYCQEYGKTYKDFNLTIRRWGIKAANEKKTETEPKSISNSVEDMMKQAGLM